MRAHCARSLASWSTRGLILERPPRFVAARSRTLSAGGMRVVHVRVRESTRVYPFSGRARIRQKKKPATQEASRIIAFWHHVSIKIKITYSES